jgi:hypothetical protein
MADKARVTTLLQSISGNSNHPEELNQQASNTWPTNTKAERPTNGFRKKQNIYKREYQLEPSGFIPGKCQRDS